MNGGYTLLDMTSVLIGLRYPMHKKQYSIALVADKFKEDRISRVTTATCPSRVSDKTASAKNITIRQRTRSLNACARDHYGFAQNSSAEADPPSGTSPSGSEPYPLDSPESASSTSDPHPDSGTGHLGA